MYIVTSLSSEKQQIKTLYVSQTFSESQDFVEDLKSIQIGDETINITAVRKYPPKEDDHDGYYLIRDQIIGDQYDIFSKKTLIAKGYVYNSIDQEIKPVLTIYITSYYNREDNQITNNPMANNPISNHLPSRPPRKNPFSIASGDLINRAVYNEMMSQLQQKFKEKFSDTEILPNLEEESNDETKTKTKTNSFVDAMKGIE